MTRTTYFGFCPCCEKETEQIHITDEKEDINVGNVTVQVDADIFHCEVCGNDYDNQSSDYDPLAQAYAEYEKLTGKKWRGTR